MTSTIKYPIFDTVDLFFRDFYNSSSTYTTPDKSKSSYPVNIYEDSTGMHFEVPCIGLDKDDIKITVNAEVLKLVYDKPDSKESESTRKYYCKGVVNRSFYLGYKFSSKFDLSKVDAKFDKGLLTINVPFSKEGELREVKIK